jgi:hypothetical protein
MRSIDGEFADLSLVGRVPPRGTTPVRKRARQQGGMGNGDLHTALEFCAAHVTEFELSKTTTGASYHFKIFHTEAVARAGHIDAALCKRYPRCSEVDTPHMPTANPTVCLPPPGWRPRATAYLTRGH